MKLVEKILLATDFSKSSDNVVENAIVLAKTFQSGITLIHVLPDNIKNEKAKLLLKEAAIKQLEVVNDRIKSESVKTDEPVLQFGSYLDNIIQTSYAISANVIIVGAGEKSKEDKFQLGTTAEKVIRKSDIPVWVIKNETTLNVETILCPVDFSSESKRALKNAITMARRFKAALMIFSVYELSHPSLLIEIQDLDEINESQRFKYLAEFDRFLEEFNLVDLNWKKGVQGGDPATEILKAANKYNSDLLIMGTTGKSGLTRMLMGSVTEKVIREVPCSFITLKSKDIIDLKMETRIRDIEQHYDVANQLVKDGFFKEAIDEYKNCLYINDMHIPSLKGLAVGYEKIGDTNNAEKYNSMAKEVVERIWDRKIEDDIRKHYKL